MRSGRLLGAGAGGGGGGGGHTAPRAKTARENETASPDRLPHARTEEGRELGRTGAGRFVGRLARRRHRGVAVDLDAVGPDPRDEVEQVRPCHPARLQKSIDALGISDTGVAQTTLAVTAEKAENSAPERLAGDVPRVDRERQAKLLRGKPDCRDCEFSSQRDESLQNDRVQMHVMVPVHVRELEAGFPEPFELGANLAGKLAAGRAGELVSDAGRNRRTPKAPVGAGETGDLRGRKSGGAVHADQGQPGGGGGRGTGESGRFRRRVAVDHEARVGQDTALVGLDDGLVDATGKTEVVAGHDEPSHIRASRRERKRKNSPPSRSRRVSIWRLVSISAVISAIFFGRK